MFVLFVLLDLERFGNVSLPHSGLDLVQLCVGSSATGKDGDAFCLRPGGNDLINGVVGEQDEDLGLLLLSDAADPRLRLKKGGGRMWVVHDDHRR